MRRIPGEENCCNSCRWQVCGEKKGCIYNGKIVPISGDECVCFEDETAEITEHDVAIAMSLLKIARIQTVSGKAD